MNAGRLTRLYCKLWDKKNDKNILKSDIPTTTFFFFSGLQYNYNQTIIHTNPFLDFVLMWVELLSVARTHLLSDTLFFLTQLPLISQQPVLKDVLYVALSRGVTVSTHLREQSGEHKDTEAVPLRLCHVLITLQSSHLKYCTILFYCHSV